MWEQNQHLIYNWLYYINRTNEFMFTIIIGKRNQKLLSNLPI